MLLVARYYRHGVPGPHHLVLEGLLAAILGTLFGMWVFPAEVSLVAIFLAAITAADSGERLLEDNRSRIIERGIPPHRANTRLVLLVLCLFAGTMLGFSVPALGLPLDVAQLVFAHQLESYGTASFPGLEFGSIGTLVVNNLYVLLFFFAIAIPFRRGGVMLAVAWNASVWGSTFGILARRWSQADGPGIVEAYVRVVAACMPHLAMEAVAYVLAGFAGVFLSKGLVKYPLDSDILVSIGRTVVAMMLLAASLVTLGAIWEGTLALVLVQALSG